ncbi:hypothetical protein V5O48_007157 [Marasmius crinis-equi]|uniref:Uncharacterized protein n=1 Tax=Marasmius crinis-equi TaxID=585013 RepID=A0ABR3FHQ2_9AGAR
MVVFSLSPYPARIDERDGAYFTVRRGWTVVLSEEHYGAHYLGRSLLLYGGYFVLYFLSLSILLGSKKQRTRLHTVLVTALSALFILTTAGVITKTTMAALDAKKYLVYAKDVPDWTAPGVPQPTIDKLNALHIKQ